MSKLVSLTTATLLLGTTLFAAYELVMNPENCVCHWTATVKIGGWEYNCDTSLTCSQGPEEPKCKEVSTVVDTDPIMFEIDCDCGLPEGETPDPCICRSYKILVDGDPPRVGYACENHQNENCPIADETCKKDLPVVPTLGQTYPLCKCK